MKVINSRWPDQQFRANRKQTAVLSSPVDLRFDLEQIATETNSSKIVSIGLQKQHQKSYEIYLVQHPENLNFLETFSAAT